MAVNVKKSPIACLGKVPHFGGVYPKTALGKSRFDVIGAPTSSTATSRESANMWFFQWVNGSVFGFWGRRSPQFPNKIAHYPFTHLPIKKNKTIHNIITIEGIYIAHITLIEKRLGFWVNVSRGTVTTTIWRAAA